MTNRKEYIEGVIERAEAYEKAHLMQTGVATKRLEELRRFIRESNREPRREAAKRARVA
jgi:hypothetical protein